MYLASYESYLISVGTQTQRTEYTSCFIDQREYGGALRSLETSQGRGVSDSLCNSGASIEALWPFSSQCGAKTISVYTKSSSYCC